MGFCCTERKILLFIEFILTLLELKIICNRLQQDSTTISDVCAFLDTVRKHHLMTANVLNKDAINVVIPAFEDAIGKHPQKRLYDASINKIQNVEYIQIQKRLLI